MEKLNGIVEECFYLRDFVKFNLFMLDCRRVNRVLISLLREIQDLVTDYFKALNQKENRRFVRVVMVFWFYSLFFWKNIYKFDRTLVVSLSHKEKTPIPLIQFGLF